MDCSSIVAGSQMEDVMDFPTRLALLYKAIIVIGLICGSEATLAQSSAGPKHVPLQKTIGQAKPEVVPSLIVMNSRAASLEEGKLTLTGVAPNSIIFADRPVRSAGHALTSHLIEDWAAGSDNFADNPPNATISVFSKSGGDVRDAVIVLKAPKLDGDKLTFDVDVLEGDLANADGPASVFIDIIGMPRTPRSFAGAARRGAFYVGAPVVVAPYVHHRCGYYPFPPCY
jgi:hypothetical protein